MPPMSTEVRTHDSSVAGSCGDLGTSQKAPAKCQDASGVWKYFETCNSAWSYVNSQSCIKSTLEPNRSLARRPSYSWLNATSLGERVRRVWRYITLCPQLYMYLLRVSYTTKSERLAVFICLRLCLELLTDSETCCLFPYLTYLYVKFV